MNEAEAAAYALRLLSRRAYTTGELLDKLQRRGASPETGLSVVCKYERLKYLDDREYARQFAEVKSLKGYGPRRVESALRRKRVSPSLIQEVLASAIPSEDPLEGALKALGPPGNHRLRPKKGEDPRRHASRLFSFLARRGFPSSTARAAVQRALKVEPDNLEP